jgi:hypothetical protein
VEKPELSAREQRKLKRKQSRKPVVLPNRKLDEGKQMKAEIGDQELSKSHKLGLQQHYGIVTPSESDIEWYLSLDASEVRANGQY